MEKLPYRRSLDQMIPLDEDSGAPSMETPPTPHLGTDWLIQHCTTPGCTVAIRVRAGQQMDVPVCKWCLAGTSYYRGERWKDWKKV